MAKAIPEGYATITPYIVVNDVPTAIEFYKRAFDAEQLSRFDGPDGKPVHAEVKIGNSILMMTSEMNDGKNKPTLGPLALKGTPVSFMLYVNDVDVFSKKAVGAGIETIRPIENQFYGDRVGTFRDPFGHIWSIATHIEDVPPDMLKKKVNEMYSKG